MTMTKPTDAVRGTWEAHALKFYCNSLSNDCFCLLSYMRILLDSFLCD